MVINKSGVDGTEAALEAQRPTLCQKLSARKALWERCWAVLIRFHKESSVADYPVTAIHEAEEAGEVAP